jgi:heme-degrading monooxygenase HmoA
MHARMFEFEGSAAEIEAAVELARAEILPLERQMPGFRGLLLLADRDAGRLVSLSLWDSEELMQESEASARMITRLGAQSIGGKRVAAEPFEVELFELGSSE